MVLWVLAFLSVIVGEFCFAMRTEVNITRNFKEQTEAYYIALAGLNRAIGELIRNAIIPQTVKQPKREGEEKEHEGKEKEDYGGEEEDRWRINVDIPPVPFGRGQFEVRIENESGKVDINRAGESLLRMILKPFALEEQEKNIIVDSILDWRDKDNLHRLNGAEDDYYKSLPRPYECKDGDFDSVEELLMVRGVTPEIFYNGLRDLVTVYVSPTREIRRDAGFHRVHSDPNKININAASRAMLLALPLMTDDLAQEVVKYREESDFRSLDDVASVVGSDVYAAIGPYINLEISPQYTIKAIGKVVGTQIEQGVEVAIEINRGLKKGYRVIQWRDTIEDKSERIQKK